jgi:PST family polysaccharide transporter
MLAGITLTLLATLTSPLIAGFFKRVDATPVLYWMSLFFVIQAFGQTSTSLLRRNLDHKRVQLLMVSSYLVGYLLIGTPLAFSGAGVWALVSAQLSQAALYSLGAYLSVRHSLLPAFKADQSGLFGFGAKVLASNLSSWGYLSLDSAVIGRMLGVVDLGLYSRGLNLVSSPTHAAVSTLQGVLFPLYARLQGQTDKIQRIYLGSVCLLSVIMMPTFAGLAAIPDTAIHAIYGESWQAAAVLITPLALAMPVYTVMALAGPMMLGMGRAGMEAVSQGIGLLVLIIALILAAQISLAAVAWAVLLAYLLRALLVSRLAMGLVSVGVLSLARALAGPMLLGLLAAGFAGFIDQALANSASGSVMLLAADIGLTGVAVAVAMLLLGRWILCAEARSLLLQLKHHLPHALSWLISRWCGISADPLAARC